METTLGEKIKAFRKRAGLSQLQLETQIGASPGSLSRIESNQINPTKETIIKVIDILKLKPYEIASLFDIQQYELADLIKVSNMLSSSLNIDDVLQCAVNEITYELNLLGTGIFPVVNNQINSRTFTKTWYTDVYRKVLPKRFEDYYIPLNNHQGNLIARTVIERKMFYTNCFEEATIGAYPKEISKIVAKVIGFKSGISLPIINEDKVLGAIFYAKSSIDAFQNELPLLEAFTNHIGVAMNNAQKYENLLSELRSFNTQKSKL